LNRILNKLRLKGTVQDLRKRRPSAREGVEEVTNNDKVEEVSAQLDAESERRADEPGSSTRRNPFNISPSSFWKIAKKKLKLHPFKLRKHQKLRRGIDVRRLDDLNDNKQAMVVRSVHKMKAKAAACVAVGGGVFEGRKV